MRKQRTSIYKKEGYNRADFIKRIHVLRRNLALDEETYRALLSSVTGRSSCTEMTVRELNAVFLHMKGKASNSNRKSLNKHHRVKLNANGEAKCDAIHVIRSLWHQMCIEGFIVNGSERALDEYVKRMTNIETVGWLDVDSAVRVLESLKRWHRRVMMQRLKLDIESDKSYSAVRTLFAEQLNAVTR